MSSVTALALAAAAAVVGILAGWLAHRVRYTRMSGRARNLGDQIIADARLEADDVLKSAQLEAKDELLKASREAERAAQEQRRDLSRRQEVLDDREHALNRKMEFLDAKEGRLDQREQELKRGEAALQEQTAAVANLERRQLTVLEEVAGLTRDEARRRLAEAIVDDARQHAALEVKRIHEQTERTAKQQAQKILATAIQRYAAPHVAEESVSVVPLPGDEMKGRIIGREGRNIRAFEEATGVDVIIDDTPEAVVLSAFDPVRREVARLSLVTLIKDGRIHPGRIEEVVSRTREEMAERNLYLMWGTGAVSPYDFDAAADCWYKAAALGHPKAKESLWLIEAADRGGFGTEILADFAEKQGSQNGLVAPVMICAARFFDVLCRKYGESDVVINAVEGHHNDVEPTSVYTFLTAAADAASAGRPGARRESIENYVTRLESLERIAASFAGVQKSYAIQAGREVRIMVDHNLVSDDQAALLAEEIGRRVETELEYPGQIKIMVIRETRASALAR